MFSTQRDLLESHRGYDLGAKLYAQTISQKLSWPLWCGDVTRLVVDLNRSLHHPHLFSSMTKRLDCAVKSELLTRYYTPFRSHIRQLVERKVAAGDRVIHISCHSFSPVLGDVERSMDLGILYDPKREHEKSLSMRILQKLKEETSMRVRLNAPYKGISDGHVTSLRSLFSPDQYVGLELEVNQSLYMPIKSKLWQHAWLPRLIEILHFLAVSEE